MPYQQIYPSLPLNPQRPPFSTLRSVLALPFGVPVQGLPLFAFSIPQVPKITRTMISNRSIEQMVPSWHALTDSALRFLLPLFTSTTSPSTSLFQSSRLRRRCSSTSQPSFPAPCPRPLGGTAAHTTFRSPLTLKLALTLISHGLWLAALRASFNVAKIVLV